MTERKVFYSYAHNDYPIILIVLESVKDSHDLIFTDRNIIKPGDIWREEIGKAIKKCKCLFLFASYNSINSKEVQMEMHFAISLKKKIIPVLLEKCDLPYEINNIHHIDLTNRSEEQLEVFKQTLSGISSKKNAKPPVDDLARVIVKDIKESDSIYNKILLPYKYVWYSTIVMILLCFVGIIRYSNDINKSAGLTALSNHLLIDSIRRLKLFDSIRQIEDSIALSNFPKTHIENNVTTILQEITENTVNDLKENGADVNNGVDINSEVAGPLKDSFYYKKVYDFYLRKAMSSLAMKSIALRSSRDNLIAKNDSLLYKKYNDSLSMTYAIIFRLESITMASKK
jgi:hypothetical protein